MVPGRALGLAAGRLARGRDAALPARAGGVAGSVAVACSVRVAGSVPASGWARFGFEVVRDRMLLPPLAVLRRVVLRGAHRTARRSAASLAGREAALRRAVRGVAELPAGSCALRSVGDAFRRRRER